MEGARFLPKSFWTGAIYLQGIGLDGSARSAGAMSGFENDCPNPDNAQEKRPTLPLSHVANAVCDDPARSQQGIHGTPARAASSAA